MLLLKIEPDRWEQVSQYSGGIGAISFAIGIILSRFAEGIGADFLSGLLMGLSVVANLLALTLFGRYKRYREEIRRNLIPNSP